MTPTPKPMTDDLFAQFDLAVFEQLPNGSFQPVGRLPFWLQTPAGQIKEGLFDPGNQFPIPEAFLSECEAVWAAGAPERIQSDIWIETDYSGHELYLEAVATASGGRRFIAIRSLPQTLHTYQQLRHDFELKKKEIERLSGELEVKRREAERATQAKSDFLATMSHEFRTPLNAIIGMADVLALTPLTAEQQKYVEIFQGSGVSLLNLMNEILDLAGAEASHIELEAANMDLRDVLARAMEVVELRTTAKGLWLRQTIAPDVPRYLIGDPNRLRQIIIHLLGNSIKFTERGGLDVKVELDPESTDRGRFRFSIADTGIGIPEDKLGLIFESFTQADSSTTRKYGGTGLGLAVSKRLVELMDGRIWVESKAGVGSTFFFTARFQIQRDQSERRAAPNEPATQVSAAELEALTAGLRILLVEDSEANRILVLQYMKRIQSTIDVAENGRIGVELFRTRRYDVVLMDVEMPVMDGYQAVGEIRRIEKETGAAPTPVLALTAHAFANMAAQGYAAGFTDLLTKPLRRVTLLEALAKYGSSRKDRPVATPDPVRVRVEEGMEDIVPRYLEKRRADAAIYRKNLDAGDFSAIRQLAHNMKGTGAGYGFPRLTELGTAIEKAAIGSDASAIRESVEEFAAYVEKVELE